MSLNQRVTTLQYKWQWVSITSTLIVYEYSVKSIHFKFRLPSPFLLLVFNFCVYLCLLLALACPRRFPVRGALFVRGKIPAPVRSGTGGRQTSHLQYWQKWSFFNIFVFFYWKLLFKVYNRKLMEATFLTGRLIIIASVIPTLNP